MKRGIKYDFSLLALLLVPVGVSLSVVGYQMSTILKLPIFVDQIGTLLVSMIAGPWVGMVTGLLSNCVTGSRYGYRLRGDRSKHMGMKICGISCITNMAASIFDQPLNHKEVQEVVDRVQQQFSVW